MQRIHLFISALTLLFSQSVCLADRAVSALATSASATTVVVYNPSASSQVVTVTFAAAGSEEINNAYLVAGGTCYDSAGSPFACFKFGICANASCSSFLVPGGSAVTCDAGFTTCSGTASIPSGAMKRFGVGSILSMTGCHFGCQAQHQMDSASGVRINISVAGSSGTVVGYLEQFDDLTNKKNRTEFSHGKPF